MGRLPSTLNPQQSTTNVRLGLLLRPWMKLSMHRFQSLLIDMRVNLRGRNIGMSEHFLNDPQVRTVA